MKSKGFTLLEVLLVIIILAAVFFPLLQMFSSGLLVSDEVRGTNTAVILAQQKMEEIKNTTFASITSEPRTVISSYPAYSRQVNVSMLDTPQNKLLDIQVIVYWATGEGAGTNVSIETLISNF
jgi:prepilin-type N-terminal cleavage/methylation domain-containing protein